MTATSTPHLCDFTPSDPASPPRCFVLVPCAGAGSRAGTVQPKQYQQVAGQPMVLHTLGALAAVRRIAGGVVVLSPGDDFAWPQGPAWPARFVRVPCGGSTRAQSVYQGLKALQARGALSVQHIPRADHTFSSQDARHRFIDWVLATR